MILGLIHTKGLDIPEKIKDQMASVTEEWKRNNSSLPCVIFSGADADIADHIVDLVHGKDEKAGRLDWNSVARARHNRDRNKRVELGLDLLEKYLEKGKNLTQYERDSWASDYTLTILNDVLPRLAATLGLAANELVEKYPEIENRTGLENVLRDIGVGQLKFANVRAADFGNAYGFKPAQQITPGSSNLTTQKIIPPALSAKPNVVPANTGVIAPATKLAVSVAAVPLNDPKSVRRKLRDFVPKGKNRDKLSSFLGEIKKLKIQNHPLSFCFLLRAMFEISAKAYANDHSISLVNNGNDKKLADVLKEIGKHLTNNFEKQHPLTKPIQGALTELAAKDEVLSITSLNFLVHSPTFSLDERHICTRFHNIFPLLEEMNR